MVGEILDHYRFPSDLRYVATYVYTRPSKITYATVSPQPSQIPYGVEGISIGEMYGKISIVA